MSVLIYRNHPLELGLVSVILLALPLFSGDLKKLQVDKNSPEGQFLELVALEGDGARKTALLEQFLTVFPKADLAVQAWVYGELQDRYRRAGALDKAISAGEKVLSIEPDNLEVAQMNLRLAEAKKDPELVKLWSAHAAEIAERVTKAPLPSDPDELKIAEQRVARARQLVVNTEYEDFTRAIQLNDPAKRIAALDEFVKKNPQNPYMQQIEIATFLDWKEIGDVDKTMAAAEKVLARDENREDALLFVAQVNFRRKKDPQRTLAMAAKIIELLSTAAKPEGMTDQAWIETKNRNLLLAYYMSGTIQFQAEKWAVVDKEFRAALALTEDDQFRSTLLYHLGWANYRMHAAIEAIRFYRLCAAIPGPMQEQAAKNILAVKAEYNLP